MRGFRREKKKKIEAKEKVACEYLKASIKFPLMGAKSRNITVFKVMFFMLFTMIFFY